MKCFNKKQELLNSLQVFQKGILMSITSLKGLRNQMEKKFNYKYLLTHRLNQDCLEIFFCQMRYGNRNGPNDHPAPVECLYNMKAIMLGKNPGVAASMHCNTMERDPEEYASATFHKDLCDPKNGDFDLKNEQTDTDEFLGEISETESLDYNSDEGPEEFLDYEILDRYSLDDNDADDDDDKPEENDIKIEHENFITYNSTTERTIEPHIEILRNDDADLYQNGITEFLNDLLIDMTIATKLPCLSEDGLGNTVAITFFFFQYYL